MTEAEQEPSCPAVDQLIAYVEGQGDDQARQQTEAHLDQCVACRGLVARYADALLESSVADATISVSPDQIGPIRDIATATLPVGRMVKHYRLRGLLGRGGMGEVYLAHDDRLARDVAIKLINPYVENSSSANERFLIEARAMARFSHPNIVAIHDIGEFENRPYVALEYVPGKTLAQRIRERGPLSATELVAVGRAIAEALKEAHHHGILHRDLKPSNVLMGSDGRIRVADFGLAKVMSCESDSFSSWNELLKGSGKATVGRLGTPRYMAPEQWLGEQASGATDVWGLGITLYEAASGSWPQRVPNKKALRALVLGQAEFPPLPDSTPKPLAQLIHDCLTRDALKRPGIDQVLQRLATATVAPTSSRRSMAALFAVALIVFAGLGVWWFASRNAVVGPTLVDARAQRGDASVVGKSGDAKATVERAADDMATVVDAASVVDAVNAAPKKTKTSGSRRKIARRRPTPRGVGTLFVQSTYQGKMYFADVYLDGKRRGQTPLLLTHLPAGKHRLVLRRPGYRERAMTVMIKAKQKTTKRIKLQAKR